ncbi:hypothetical protein IHN63_18905 [Deinococcus sp. 6YEL10]|uniref:hypothetical protein n=1 Tax=Deinococcus sp. 6YEL10 TaxID=2745870 RepID=UPI001E6021EE|nr:hypothetical protein [Deinococcus sp. 6YEL10]MCD0163364.1 hypothetical protein [Deinococcus sp. 6YEL10]
MGKVSFEQRKSEIYQLIDESKCRDIAERLAQLIIKDSDVVMYINNISRSPKEYDLYRSQIERIFSIYSRRRDALEEAEFASRLRELYRSYNSNRDEWVHALSLAIEYTFVQLLKEKYSDKIVEIHHECIFTYTDSDLTISTEPRPIDAIIWCNTGMVGEFLEVKKNLEVYYKFCLDNEREKLEKFVRKTETLFNLADDLGNTFLDGRSIIGYASLASAPNAEQLLESILTEIGILLEGQTIRDLNPRLLVVHPNSIAQWYRAKVV